MEDESFKLFCCVAEYGKKYEKIHAAIKPCFTDANLTEKDFGKFLSIHVIGNTSRYSVSDCSGIVHPCEEATGTQYIAYIVVWVIILMTMLLSNALVVFALRKLNFSVTNVLICSLAVSDISVGMFLIPIKIVYAAHNLKFCMSKFTCHFYITADHAFFTASITNLLVICIDRYIALNYPYKYPTWITRRRSKALVAAVWFYALFWGLMVNVKWNDISTTSTHIKFYKCQINENYMYVTTSLLTVFFIPVIIMGLMYARILFIAKSHAKGISKDLIIPSVSTEMNTLSPNIDVNGNTPKFSPFKQRYSIEKNRRTLHYRKMVFKACKTIALVYGTFVICWSPVCCMSLIYSYTPVFVGNTSNMYIIFIDVLPILNSTLNPFIYAFSNKQYKSAFGKVLSIFHIWKRKNTFTSRLLTRLNSDTFTTGF